MWLALPNKAWSLKVVGTRLKILRFSDEALSEMVEEHEIEKVAVRVYSAAKTVAD